MWSETDYSLKFRQIIIQSKTILWNIIKSRHSLKKSDREQITLLTHYKRATVYKSLSISLKKKSVVSDSVMILANRSSNLLQKTSDSLKKSILSMFLTFFPLLMPKEQIAPVALCLVAPFKERWERFAFVDLNKEQP